MNLTITKRFAFLWINIYILLAKYLKYNFLIITLVSSNLLCCLNCVSTTMGKHFFYVFFTKTTHTKQSRTTTLIINNLIPKNIRTTTQQNCMVMQLQSDSEKSTMLVTICVYKYIKNRIKAVFPLCNPFIYVAILF
jgi:hypothetical protein